MRIVVRFLLAGLIGGLLGASAVLATQVLREEPDTRTVMAEEWIGHLERCLGSLETGLPASVEGLEPADLPKLLTGVWGEDAPAAWKVADGQFRLLIGGARLGETACQVVMQAENLGLSKDAENALLRAFIEWRAGLLFEGVHEVRELDVIEGMLSLGVGPVFPNENGCNTILAVSFRENGMAPLVTVGEQLGLEGCQPGGSQ